MKVITHSLVAPALALFSILATAQDASEQKLMLNIAPQPMIEALNGWARQTGMQLIVHGGEATRELRSPNVQGHLSAREALRELLAGSPLTYQFVNERTVVIQAASQPASNGGPTEGGKLTRLAQVTPDARNVGASTAAAETDREQQRDPEEVIVTAQRRQERLEDVPIAISVLNGPTLDRSADSGVGQSLNRIPGVVASVATVGARSNRIDAVVIRGVSPAAGSSTTAYYLDSSPFGFIRFSYAPDASAYDLERVEVLRGPQGTLYGASALNGVVRILTKDANLDEFEFKARTSAASTEDGDPSYRGDVVVNMPIIEGKLAARAVVGYQKLGGWIDKPIDDDANDAELANYRLKLNAQPTDALSIGVSAWLSRSEFGAPPVSPDGRNSRSMFDEPSSTDYDVFGVKVGYDFDAFTLTSATSYIDFDQRSAVDWAPLAGPTATAFLNSIFATEVFAQEFTLNSSGRGPWRWSVGGIYRDASEQLYQTRNNPITGQLNQNYLAPTDQRTYSESFAVFGEVTLALFDEQLELTGGLRYFEDRTKDREKSRLDVVGGVPAAGLINTSNKFDNVSPRVVVSWHPIEQTTLYASYSEGFRSGLNQLPTVRARAPEFAPAQPDDLKNYEIGAKGLLWDGRLKLDSAVFYIDWQGVQQTLTLPIAPTILFPALVNAGSASGVGFDLGLSAEVFDGFVLGANYSRNDLEVDEEVRTGGLVLFPKGSRLVLSPEYTMGFSADYSFPLGGKGYEALFSAAANYMPEQFTGRTTPTAIAPSITISSDSIWMSRVTLGVESPNGWTVSLMVDNLTNEDGITARDPFSPQWYTRPRPRTIGAQLECRF